jgi:hypothetical protein
VANPAPSTTRGPALRARDAATQDVVAVSALADEQLKFGTATRPI